MDNDDDDDDDDAGIWVMQSSCGGNQYDEKLSIGKKLPGRCDVSDVELWIWYMDYLTQRNSSLLAILLTLLLTPN